MALPAGVGVAHQGDVRQVGFPIGAQHGCLLVQQGADGTDTGDVVFRGAAHLRERDAGEREGSDVQGEREGR